MDEVKMGGNGRLDKRRGRGGAVLPLARDGIVTARPLGFPATWFIFAFFFTLF